MERHTRHHTIATIAIAAAATISAAPPASIVPASTADLPAAAGSVLQMITNSPTRVELMTHAVHDFPATAAIADAAARLDIDGELTVPHVLTSGAADVIVRIRGGAICTGTPITGTTLVVTAAHCVLDDDGEVSGSRTVLRDGVEYTAGSVLVDPRYHDSPGPRLDAAVLVMEQEIPGPSATLADVFPSQGLVTVAGFQPLDTDGSLLRGTSYDNRPHPQGATGGVVEIDTAAAGCVHVVSDVEILSTELTVPCGLIPGASGGGLFVDNNGEMILVGIISTVAADLTYNGVVPLAAMHELLEDQTEYTHDMPGNAPTPSIANIARS